MRRLSIDNRFFCVNSGEVGVVFGIHQQKSVGQDSKTISLQLRKQKDGLPKR